MEIFIYKGLKDLPSIDFDCLRTIAYIKLSEAPVKVITNGNPFLSPNGFLPYLSTETDKIAGYEAIIQYLNKLGYIANRRNSENRHLSAALMCYLFHNLHPCVQYYLWGDPQNNDYTRTLYAKRTPFPFSFYYPQKYTKKVDELMQVLENFSIDDKIDNHSNANLIYRARQSLTILEQQIMQRDFLLNAYSEIDATLYSYLAIIYNIPLQSCILKLQLVECPNLLRYMEHFRKKFLTDIEVDTKTELAATKIESEDDKHFSKHTPKIVSAIVAVTVMSMFAIKQGILQITGDESLNDYNSIEYEDSSDFREDD